MNVSFLFQISQNKGLTAKKKKELRNPRVKHRRKFYKAQIKRKSQVWYFSNIYIFSSFLGINYVKLV